MVVKLKFKRLATSLDEYALVVTSRGERLIDRLGYYNPKGNYSYLEVDIKKFKYWVESGGQCSRRVLKVMNESIGKGNK